MSAETDFRAALANHPPLAALVGTRIAQNAVPQGADLPLVVFAAAHNPTRGLDGTLLVDEVTFSVQCWDEDGVVADAVADEVEVAIAGVADVIARATAYNQEIKLDCTELTVQWFFV